MISVVIPLYNAINYLEPLLSRLAEQTEPHELILIDSSSTDGTPDWLRQRQIPFHSIPQGTFHHGVTRNLGVSMAQNDTVVMLTQDALPNGPGCLEALINPLKKEPKVVLVYGRQLPYPDATPLSVFARQTNYPAQSQAKTVEDVDRLGIRTCHCSNSFAAYRKAALMAVGGFPANVVLGEDVVAAARFILNGWSIYYCGDAEVVHSHNYSIGEEFRRYFDIGAFHQQQFPLLEPFLQAESEGMRYVLSEWEFLRQQKQLALIPNQLIRTAIKYVGYRIGRMQHRLPIWVKPKLSMHRSFWEKH